MVTYRPETLSEALSVRKNTGAVLFAGGTDLMVKYRNFGGVEPSLGEDVLFLDNVRELKGLSIHEGVMTIGSAVTLTEILSSDLPVPTLLLDAVRQIAAPALRNRATLAGNIGNASPAGDSLPVLYVLNTTLTLYAKEKNRTVTLEEFITGPGKTILKDDEIIGDISFIVPDSSSESYYRKVGTRKANALTKLSVAAFWDKEIFRIAAGAVGPRIIRFHEAEKMIQGRASLEDIMAVCDPLITPIDDQRSTARYRKTTCLKLIRDSIQTYWRNK